MCNVHMKRPTVVAPDLVKKASQVPVCSKQSCRAVRVDGAFSMLIASLEASGGLEVGINSHQHGTKRSSFSSLLPIVMVEEVGIHTCNLTGILISNVCTFLQPLGILKVP